MPVLLRNHQRKVKVNTDKLRKLAQEILDQEEVDPHLELSIALVDEETIRHLNSRYRGVDKPTDVLSFSMTAGWKKPFSSPEMLLGDVLICPKIAFEQAKRLKHSLDEELAHLLAHGIGNLLGKKKREKR